MRESMDIFGDAVKDYYEGKKVKVLIRRDDGYVDPFSPKTYFRSYQDFDLYEKRALRHVEGKVLDIGCGPGRVALYLQRKGYKVTGIDCSEVSVEVAKERGVRDCRVMDARRLQFEPGTYDTIVMFGNNFGICGTKKRTKRMLRDLHMITSKKGKLIAHTMAPGADRKVHRSYLQWNLERGRDIGHVTLVFEYKGERGEPFEELFVSPVEMMQLCWETGWKVVDVITDGPLSKGYVAIAEKVL